jgi:hypothetical protein
LNPRPSPWQGDALPLSYSRLVLIEYIGWLVHGQRGIEGRIAIVGMLDVEQEQGMKARLLVVSIVYLRLIHKIKA